MTAARTLLLFGATGDLAQRMLWPSLFGLAADGLLPEGFRIVGAARQALDEGGFRGFVAAALARFVEPARLTPDRVAAFLARVGFVRLDIADPASLASLGPGLSGQGDLAIFLSTAPQLFGSAIAGLVAAGLAMPGTRLALEKPLGLDRASAAAINDLVAQAFTEAQTFRIDHYLGKETVQNLLALRFGNGLFEPHWNANGVAHVQITIAETVGLEARGGYYDAVGALRDMVQNHMLQLLALVAMEPPAQLAAGAVRDEKVKVLRALRPIDRATAATHSVIAQYRSGAIGGASVPGYLDELGDPSETETFVALKAHVDNWRWKGVPFYLRTGKRLPARRSEIVIGFRNVPHSIFGPATRLQPNRLIIGLQPEEVIRLTVMTKEPGLDRGGIRLRELPLDLAAPGAFSEQRRRIAYERLLLDLVENDPTLFVRRDEVDAQWQWIDGIRDGWAASGMRPRPYPAGTWGPPAAIGLTERDGVSWND